MKKHYQQGYILTIELILIITILIIGSIGGVILVRDALIKRHQTKVDNQITVVDANNRPLGIAVSFDEHQAPLIFYTDRGANNTYRALIGIRDDRFTSREAVYYDAPNCQGNPCLKGLSDEATDSQGVSKLNNTGNVSYINALQQGPNYAIGQLGNTVIGQLLRSTPQQCPANSEQILSRYVSQKVVTGSPCESFEIDKQPADSSCLVGVTALGRPLVGTDGRELAVSCDTCQTGYESQGDILDLYLPEVESLLKDALKALKFVGVAVGTNFDIELGTICCPEGTRLEEDENIVETLVFTILQTTFELAGIDLVNNLIISETLSLIGIEPGITYCKTSLNLVNAEQVINITTGEPALSSLTPPFKVLLPVHSGQNSTTWIHTPPKGEGERQ
ncbi:hypothetical protein PL71_17170 [Pseudoalteromonas distincta]|uniref:Uncharacterized protein n=1 Tax=Pseudoalteromonas distincta TaxID=77608 RepID=A0ABT9GGI6_9GAMM|nr:MULTISPECIES: hypothetical protein [Pseudoalteromonas distincta group]KHM45221.1 hypothetical protein PL71_17170 [Pseudoalteromonas elyakovii]KID39071.1 hypothetical protein QT16_08120 [Pseudoalteromonas distincta]MDP4485001.1 hypothetical protein [Pseudoalteromonas elyakovii]|tara:strand:- start:28223 stop:29395 length:1173 start_codon:yes stop_codon:yes gene_type:complete